MPSVDVPAAVAQLSDPDSKVRNDISRYAQAFIASVNDGNARVAMINSLARQLTRPSFTDRNKALLALLRLLEAFPEDAAAVKAAAYESILQIAKQSILPNVKGFADSILQSLDKVDQQTPPPSPTARRSSAPPAVVP